MSHVFMFAGAAIACQRATEAHKELLILQKQAPDKGWQLIGLTESFAEEKLAQLLEAAQWEAAMLLAEVHFLDKDLIHKYVSSDHFWLLLRWPTQSWSCHIKLRDRLQLECLWQGKLNKKDSASYIPKLKTAINQAINTDACDYIISNWDCNMTASYQRHLCPYGRVILSFRTANSQDQCIDFLIEHSGPTRRWTRVP